MGNIVRITPRITKDEWGNNCNKHVEGFAIGHSGLNGDNDGVLMVYKSGKNQITFAAGDDGSWRDIWSCNISWIKDVLYLVACAVVEY